MNRLLRFFLLFLAGALPLAAQRRMESLGRGVVAFRTGSSAVYVSWRLLGNDPEDIAFNLYRAANNGTPIKLNATPLTASTNYSDNPPSLGSTSYTYSVRTVRGGVEVSDEWANPLGDFSFALPANPPTRQYLPVPIQPTPDGAHTVGFVWAGDLDGDGEYDFVLARHHGQTANQRQFVEAYRRDGTLLWRINLGPNSTNHYNIEPGSSTVGIGHGDNLTVYDLDGDGKAEVILRTARGVVFADGSTLNAATDNHQFISIIDGLQGTELARAPVTTKYISDGPMQGHMGIFYPDGRRPSVLWSAKNRRDSAGGDGGFQGIVGVWDYRDGQISQRWIYDPAVLDEHAPEGHQIRFADVNNDGRDEFVDIGYTLQHDGTQLFNIPEVVHGDRFHITDMDPDRPGLETYIIQQNNPSGLATALFSTEDGRFIRKWYASSIVDVGRGLAIDIDPDHKGYEMFSTQPGIYDARGERITRYGNNRPWPTEGIWWDGDLGREFLASVGSEGRSPAINRLGATGDDSRIQPNYYNQDGGSYWLYGARANFWGDILGDWREEFVCVTHNNSQLRIYSTILPTSHRLYTLMHNPQYRIQATTKGYTQAPYVDYYLGHGMTPPPPPPMVDADLVWRGGPGPAVWDAGGAMPWDRDGQPDSFSPGDTVRFDIGGDATASIALTGTLQPVAVTVYSPRDYVFAGDGSLSGAMKFTKAGAGSLTLAGDHPFTGTTTIWDGALIVNGELSGSPVTVWGGTWGGIMAAGRSGGRLAGTGVFGAHVTVRYRGAITPGTDFATPATLTFAGGLALEDDSLLVLGLSDDPGGTAKPHDRVHVAGNLVLSGSIGLIVEALDDRIEPGSYPLITYTGTLTGSSANLDLRVPPGIPYTLTTDAGAITLHVAATRDPDTVTWRGSGSVWDLAASENWLLGGNPGVFVSGDAVTFDATGSAATAVTLATELSVASVLVDSDTDYTFSGPGGIAGPGGLTKRGPGLLTLNVTNSYTGSTRIEGGVVAVTEFGDGGSPGAFGASPGDPSNLVLDGGTLRLTAQQTNTNRGLTIGPAGGTLHVIGNNGSMQTSGLITGPGSLTKTGPGTLIISHSNNHSGGTTIAAGTVFLSGPTPNVSGLGSGPITLAGGTLTMADARANISAPWHLVVPEGAAGRLNADGRCSLTGSLTGAGTLTYFTPFVRTDLRGNWSVFTGTIEILGSSGGGDFRVGNNFGYANAALVLGADSFLHTIDTTPPAGRTVDLGSVAGHANSGIGGGPTGGRTVTWRVGNRGEDTTFAGSIVNGTGPTAVTKVGAGVWTLTGACTYTGPTIVSSGRLSVSGALGNTTVTVQSAGALGGSGVIAGPVTCHGTLAPGDDAPGTLTLQGGLTLSSTAVIDLEIGAASDSLQVAGNLTLAGTLNVAAAPGIAPGTYMLATYTGTLTDNGLTLGSLPAGFTGSVAASGGTVRLTLNPELTPYQQWQIEYFGSIADPDAAPDADPDGDGTPNAVEFRLGLDPKDGSAFFKAEGSATLEGFTITWPSAPDLSFEIWRSTSLEGVWERLDTVTGTGTYTDPSPPPGRGFYRVALLP